MCVFQFLVAQIKKALSDQEAGNENAFATGKVRGGGGEGCGVRVGVGTRGLDESRRGTKESISCIIPSVCMEEEVEEEHVQEVDGSVVAGSWIDGLCM